MLLKKKLTFKNILRVYKFFGGRSVKEKRRHQSAASSGKGIGERVGKKTAVKLKACARETISASRVPVSRAEV